MVLFNSSVELEALSSIPVLLFASFFISSLIPAVVVPLPLNKGCCPAPSTLPMCRQGESKEVDRRCSVTLAGEEPSQVALNPKSKARNRQRFVRSLPECPPSPAVSMAVSLCLPDLFSNLQTTSQFQPHLTKREMSPKC